LQIAHCKLGTTKFNNKFAISNLQLAMFGVLFALSCAPHAAEQLLLEQFFSASRLRDRTALQPISTVIFEPRLDGTVTTFTVTSVVDLEQAGGQVKSKQVTVTAPVRLPNGGTATKRLIFVLERRDRWVVTGFTVAGSA